MWSHIDERKKKSVSKKNAKSPNPTIITNETKEAHITPPDVSAFFDTTQIAIIGKANKEYAYFVGKLKFNKTIDKTKQSIDVEILS